MAYEDIQDLFDLVDSRLADNKTRNITPAKHREVIYAIINQWKECQCVKKIEVEITPTQMNTASSSPITILPALGVGKYYHFVQFDRIRVYGGTEYTGIPPTAIIRYDSGTQIFPGIDVDGTLDVYDNLMRDTPMYNTIIPNDSILFVGLDDFAAGNSTEKFIIRYIETEI